MNVLIVHDLAEVDDTQPGEESLKVSVTFRNVQSADLSQFVKEADMVAFAGPASLPARSWARAVEEVRAFEVPTVRAEPVHTDQWSFLGASGNCVVQRSDTGELEVSCLAQHLALKRLAAIIRGESGKAPSPIKNHKTRLIYDGEGPPT